jgi:Putative lumazine-binding
MVSKKSFFLALALMFSLGSFAQSSDLLAIEKTCNDYLIGGTENDAERVASAFHPNARMIYLNEGKYTEVNAAQFFRERIKPGPAQERKTAVLSIEINGHAAFAKLHIVNPRGAFFDYMTLLKIDGTWKIINKSFFFEENKKM